MIALDANNLVRVFTAGSHPDQLAVALETMRTQNLWVCRTILLETEWVLRYSYERREKCREKCRTNIQGSPVSQFGAGLGNITPDP